MERRGAGRHRPRGSRALRHGPGPLRRSRTDRARGGAALPGAPARAAWSMPARTRTRSVRSGPRPRASPHRSAPRESGPMTLDLVKDGPHGLVGGTTGSGKSEFLRSLVAGLAARNDPTRLNFILIDFKGGAAFDACERLPHTIGTISNLDEQLADRALRSLEAEMASAASGSSPRPARTSTTSTPTWPPTRPSPCRGCCWWSTSSRCSPRTSPRCSPRWSASAAVGPHPGRAHDPCDPAPRRRGQRRHPGQHQPAGGPARAEPRRLLQRHRRPRGRRDRPRPDGAGLHQAGAGRHHPGADGAGHRARVHPVRHRAGAR